MAQILYPLVSAAQSFTDTQKAQARTNIGAAAAYRMATPMALYQEN